MPHIHWVARQNKLEIPRDKDEVKQREIRESDGQAHDPDTMVAPLTPKSTVVGIFFFFPQKLASEGVKGGSAEDRKVHSCFV
jgi:hypothetical protein